MPSYTSDSDYSKSRLRPDRFTVILLGTFLVVLALLEFVSRERFDSTSKVQRREVSERKAVLSLRGNATDSDRHIVFVGNSLMLDGVTLPVLETHLKAHYVPVPYFVLGSNYYDWLFGLKRLFAEGMRPEYIVLGLSPDQLASSELRGDISARYMVQQSDLINVVRQTHMDATRASEFILAHYSEYYSTREITRGYVMSRVLPSVGELLHSEYANVRAPGTQESVLKPLAASRLAALEELCRSNGASLLFVVPPTYQEGTGTIVAAGQERGVVVLVPVEYNQFDASDYQQDGFHLNEKGADIFTLRLAESLNKKLPD